jgi:cellulose-binding protein
VSLDASESSDPDDDDLSYRWWIYGEPGTYEAMSSTTYSTSAKFSLRIPSDAAGKTMHLILEIRDDGLPTLTSYRRIIIEVEE